MARLLILTKTSLPMKTAFYMLILGLFLGSLDAQEINNADFSRGKAGWLGDGKVVYIDSSGTVSATASPGATPAIQIDLSKNDWREVKQKLHANNDDSLITFSVQIKSSPDFKRLETSRKYSDVDFGEGGGYSWSALVFPKCDFLIRVQDDTWYYRPFSLSPAGTWKSFTASFPKLKMRQREIALLFPPGEGSVLVKGK